MRSNYILKISEDRCQDVEVIDRSKKRLSLNSSLGAISHSYLGMSFVHCWRPYCDCGLWNAEQQ